MPDKTCVVINKFVVPETARREFLAEFAEHRAFLAARPGFLSGRLYIKQGGSGRFNIVNIAQWESEGALQMARDALGTLYAQSGKTPGDAYQKLGVEADIATYTIFEAY